MSHTVVGLFNNRNEAQAAKQELIQHGFTAGDIDVSNRRASTGNTGAADRTAATTTNTVATTTEIEVTDSVGNFFRSLFGGDETSARNHTAAAGDADAILTVYTNSNDKARQAAEILDRNGAIDIDAASARQQQVTQTVETSTQNTARAAETTARNVADTKVADTKGETVIPIVEEQLNVGKREVESGGARVRSRIIEKPVEASIRLREEHVVVERRPVNRTVTDADMVNAKQGDITITESAEVPVVAKEARVVEEVVIGKNVTERQETVRDTVKRTDVEVEEVNADTTARRADNKS